MLAFVDHGGDGTGEPLAWLLRPGNAGANTAADHITVVRQCLRQLPCAAKGGRVGRKVLIRADGAGGTHDFVEYLTKRKLSYSLGFGLSDDIVARLATIPTHVWTPAYDADGDPRDGAWVAEATGVLDLSLWPKGMRVIVRKERPHPGAQLRFTDVDGLRLTAFVTNSARGQLADLELRHRQGHRPDQPAAARLRAEPDLARHRRSRGRAHCLDAHARAGPPPRPPVGTERLRLRLFSIAGRIARHARRTHLRLSGHAPWSGLIQTALARLAALPAPT